MQLTVVQGDQRIMTVFFLYLVKSDLSSVRFRTRVRTKDSRKRRPYLTGHPEIYEIRDIIRKKMWLSSSKTNQNHWKIKSIFCVFYWQSLSQNEIKDVDNNFTFKSSLFINRGFVKKCLGFLGWTIYTF